jgi:hypothetical protein
MNTKRHLSLVLLGMIIVLPLLTTSCFKKGEEDPFFSMYTRKARVTGEWKISNYESKIKRTDQNNPDQLLTTTTIDNGGAWLRVVQILGAEDSIVEYPGQVVEGRNIIIYYSDGRFVETLEYEYTFEEDDGNGTVLTTIYKVQEELNGTWNFLNNIDDYKNKERLAIVVEQDKSKTFVYEVEVSEEDETIPVPTLVDTYSSSRKYANGEISTIWTLRMLKNKQIIQDQNVDRIIIETENNIGVVYSEVGNITRTLTRD